MKGKDVYLRVLKFVYPYWPRLLVAMVCMAAVSAITAAFALLTKNVLDDIFINKDRFMLTVLPLAIMGMGIINFIVHSVLLQTVKEMYIYVIMIITG